MKQDNLPKSFLSFYYPFLLPGSVLIALIFSENHPYNICCAYMDAMIENKHVLSAIIFPAINRLPRNEVCRQKPAGFFGNWLYRRLRL
jgi:hypothetical protein